MMLNTSQIKPDPNQPRRTFDAEKMAALESSMRESGFRTQYPIIVDTKNVIIDGERRWRAAKKVGIKSIPVEIKAGVADWERLLYQLQSEGSELSVGDKYEAWHKLWEKSGQSKANLAKALGVSPITYDNRVRDYDDYLKLLAAMKKKNTPEVKTVSFDTNFPAMSVIAKEKNTGLREALARKAIKENWTRDKAQVIRGALDEKPLKSKNILSHDYSGDTWKMTLEVAKAGFTEKEAREINEVSDQADEMYSQIQAFSDIIMYGLKMAAAMRQFNYKQVTPQKRIELHQKLQKFVPFATGYIGKLEAYMIDKGELKRNVKLIK